jgi:predicted dehydrogenase
MPAWTNRRTFLGAAIGASVSLVSTEPTPGAGETINVGCIGTGGRCRQLMKSFAGIKGARLAAVCDIYDAHLEEGKKLADARAFATKHFRELLDRKDIDAVLIGAPDHWHVPMTIEACRAGKDVYVEKPLTHSLEEGKSVIEAVRKEKRVVQVGMQQRSMPQFVQGAELIKAGRLGKVCKVRLSWNRNTDRVRRGPTKIDRTTVDWKGFLGSAREQPYDEYRFRNWRWFWDFGGGIFTDLMVHFIDVAHWFLGLEHPLKATSIGTQLTSKGVWETPDTVQTLMIYPNDLQVHFEGTFSNARAGAMIEFMGTDATLYLDRGRFELIPERGRGKPEEMILGTGPRGKDFYDKPDGELLHLANWLESIRTRKDPSSPVEAGVGSASAAHLANQGLRSGEVVVWKE